MTLKYTVPVLFFALMLLAAQWATVWGILSLIEVIKPLNLVHDGANYIPLEEYMQEFEIN